MQDVFSPELWLMVSADLWCSSTRLCVSLIKFAKMLENCSPMDVKNLRETCRPIRRFIDANPSIWAVARQHTGNVPPPPDPDLPEWKWAVIMFTGTVRLTY